MGGMGGGAAAASACDSMPTTQNTRRGAERAKPSKSAGMIPNGRHLTLLHSLTQP